MTRSLGVDPATGEFVLTISPRDRDLAAQVPGLRFHKASETWRSKPLLSVAHTLRGVFGESLSVSDEAFAAVSDQARDHSTVQAFKDGAAAVVPLVETEGMREAQQVASWLAAKRGGFLIGDEKGYGKSVEAAGSLNLANMSRSAYPALIIATNSMKYVWKDEITKWCGVPAAVMGRTATERKAAIEAVANGDAQVLICSWNQVAMHSFLAPFGSVARTDKEKEPKELNDIPWQTVIADEAHKLKNPKAKQTRAAWAVAHAPSVINRWALTATPITGHTIDLWGVLHFIRPDDFPARSKFVDRYVLLYKNFHNGIEDLGLNPANEAEFRKLFDPCYIRRPLDLDVGMLPPQYRFVDMEGKQRSVYRAIEKESIADVDGKFLVAAGPLVLNTRLQQLAQATPVLDDDGNVTEFTLPSCKYDVLLDVLDEMGGKPLVVFSASRKLIELCHRELIKNKSLPYTEDNIGLITGSVSPEARHRWIERFQAGELPIILCTIGAGSEGITLTRASTMLFLSRDYRFVGNSQAEGRLLRYGQTEDVQIIDAVTRDSEELRVHEASSVKEGRLQGIVLDPEWKERDAPQDV